MFSETQIELDVQELCSKYNLDYNEYNKIKQIVIQGAHDPEPDPGYATLFLWNLGTIILKSVPIWLLKKLKKQINFI